MAIGTDFSPINSKKPRGRPKQPWTQADTARELGISQQSVSNALRIATAIELCPALAKYKGTAILAALRFIANPEKNIHLLENTEVNHAFMDIADWLSRAK